jgi:hypothetical protein
VLCPRRRPFADSDRGLAAQAPSMDVQCEFGGVRGVLVRVGNIVRFTRSKNSNFEPLRRPSAVTLASVGRNPLSWCHAVLKTENVGNGVGLLHLNRIFRTFGAGWRRKT